jgi:hypothetical protein
MKRMLLIILAVSAVASMLGACNPAESSTTPATNVSKATAPVEAEATATQTEVPAKTELDLDSAAPDAELRDATDKMVFAQTNLQPDGNRIVGGTGNIPALTAQDVPLEGRPTWVTAVPVDGGLLWVVVLEDGRTQAFFVRNGQAEPYAVTPDQIPAGMPPLLQLENGEAAIVVPNGESSLLTHPVSINGTDDTAYIDASGNLVVQQAGIPMTLSVNAQPDARILVDENGRLLLHTDPTDEYGHGIMGDKLEAGSLTLVATQPEPEIIRTIPAADGYVLEGIAPIWVDLDGDGMREIVVTRSNANDGAQIVVLDETGNLLATGPAIGQGGRWRHQLSAGPFGPNGEMELVDVLTPHIGGPTEFFQWKGDELVVVADVNGYTSHVIGSRNLDMNAAGQFDESGRLTLLLPNQARTELGGIQRSDDGAQLSWTLPLSGQLVTNIAASPLIDGRLAVGVGLDNHTLRIWQP